MPASITIPNDVGMAAAGKGGVRRIELAVTCSYMEKRITDRPLCKRKTRRYVRICQSRTARRRATVHAARTTRCVHVLPPRFVRPRNARRKLRRYCDTRLSTILSFQMVGQLCRESNRRDMGWTPFLYDKIE